MWKTYTASYAHHEPRLKDIAPSSNNNGGSDADDAHLWIILSVIDKGIGIKANDLLKLGTAFTQLSQVRSRLTLLATSRWRENQAVPSP